MTQLASKHVGLFCGGRGGLVADISTFKFVKDIIHRFLGTVCNPFTASICFKLNANAF